MTKQTTSLDASDMVLIAQEMSAAFRKYAESADLLRSLEETPGQFANAISGQRQMAHACAVIAGKAKALRGFTDDELKTDAGHRLGVSAGWIGQRSRVGE